MENLLCTCLLLIEQQHNWSYVCDMLSFVYAVSTWKNWRPRNVGLWGRRSIRLTSICKWLSYLPPWIPHAYIHTLAVTFYSKHISAHSKTFAECAFWYVAHVKMAMARCRCHDSFAISLCTHWHSSCTHWGLFFNCSYEMMISYFLGCNKQKSKPQHTNPWLLLWPKSIFSNTRAHWSPIMCELNIHMLMSMCVCKEILDKAMI